MGRVDILKQISIYINFVYCIFVSYVENKYIILLSKVHSKFSALKPWSLYKFILKNTKWPFLKRNKKHKKVKHYKNLAESNLLLQKEWKKKSGIYKITFLPFRLFFLYRIIKRFGE